MKIAIFGSGGLGAYYGARLQQAGNDVTFIARGEHLQAFNENGLTLYSPLGDAHLKPVVATSDPASAGVQDLVLIAVKSWQMEEVAIAVKPLVGEHTVVIPFLNGVEAPDSLVKELGTTPVLGGLSRIFSKIESPGVIRHFNDSAYVEFGELDASSSSKRCIALQNVFTDAGIEATISEDIRKSLWQKLILVSAWGGLGALSQSTMGELRCHTETRELITGCLKEAVAIAGAEGHAFESGLAATLWKFYDALPDAATTSLSRDVLAGKPSELEAWHGVIVRLAQVHKIDAPNHQFIYQALLPMERRARSKS